MQQAREHLSQRGQNMREAGLQYEKIGDSRRLACGYKLRIVVLLSAIMTKLHL